jgi:hypothetical protein
MISDRDIEKLTSAFSKVFATKQELLELKDEIRKESAKVIAVVDGYSKRFDEQRQECLLVNNYVNRHEKNFVDIRNTIKTASD